MAMTVTGICHDLFGIIHIEDASDVPDNIVKEAITAINLAVQTLWSTPNTFFLREPETIDAAAGTSLYEMPKNVRRIIGPVLNNATGKPLMRLENEVQARNYEQLFLDEPDTPIGSHATQAFLVHRQKGSGYDNAKASVWLVPSPTDEDSFTVDVVREPESYGVGDYGGETMVELPHEFTETLLLPIARHEFTRSHYMNDPFKADQYKADYDKAMVMLGLQDPQMSVDPMEGAAR